MQTTLLGVAIAIILALVTALVAPLVVDWNHYRGAVEAEASRLSGLAVHVNGPIDARLLPSPVITLHDIDAGEAGHQPRLRAGMLKVELALGPLLRGKMQASEVHLIAPQVSLGFDRSGAVEVPALSSSFDPEALSISRFSVEDGRVTLTDAGRLAAAAAAALLQRRYPFAVRTVLRRRRPLWLMASFTATGFPAAAPMATASRSGSASNPSNRPLTTDWDGTLTFNHGVPQFDGALAVARPAGATLANGQRVTSVPWRAEGSIKATPASAALRNLAFRYGPEERALNFTGTADLTFGAHPRLDGDRVGDAGRRGSRAGRAGRDEPAAACGAAKFFPDVCRLGQVAGARSDQRQRRRDHGRRHLDRVAARRSAVRPDRLEPQQIPIACPGHDRPHSERPAYRHAAGLCVQRAGDAGLGRSQLAAGLAQRPQRRPHRWAA